MNKMPVVLFSATLFFGIFSASYSTIRPNQPILTDVTENSSQEIEIAQIDNSPSEKYVDENGDENVEKSYPEGNCTVGLGSLMLINPNFIVDEDFISARRQQLINIENLYGIHELNAHNGEPLLDEEAAAHLNQMLEDYYSDYPGHEINTVSCFRPRGTSCGRLCYATGTSDHHSGYTCDLIDSAYGTSLDTDKYDEHYEWQWLHANSYKYGFIDRFIESWAGGSMDEPVNVDETGTTGLYETWHYRYVGIKAATEIATGKYNNGEYDSLEHYLLAAGYVSNLLDQTSCSY